MSLVQSCKTVGMKKLGNPTLQLTFQLLSQLQVECKNVKIQKSNRLYSSQHLSYWLCHIICLLSSMQNETLLKYDALLT